MNIAITFRQMNGTDSVKAYAHDKIAKLQKFLRQPMTAQVTLSQEGTSHACEVHVSSGPTHIHGSEAGDDVHAAIDLVVDKLEKQIRSHKGAHVTKKRRGPSAGEFAAQQPAGSQRGTRG
ncbi:MAG: ribosome-associated translation inhibitor RaiA [Myxococcales bacterium]|nr:ribosome-associated translation inhibitor RaiA [Myxococcales bacterium]